MQRDAGEIAVKPRSRRKQNDAQKYRAEDFLHQTHPGGRSARGRGRTRDEVRVTLSVEQFMVLFGIAHFAFSEWDRMAFVSVIARKLLCLRHPTAQQHGRARTTGSETSDGWNGPTGPFAWHCKSVVREIGRDECRAHAAVPCEIRAHGAGRTVASGMWRLPIADGCDPTRSVGPDPVAVK
jgi:hypothetical protein